MPLISSLLLLLASGAHWVLRRRAPERGRWLPAGAASGVVLLALASAPGRAAIPLWRPVARFGPGLDLSLDPESRPFLLLAGIALLAVSLIAADRIGPLWLVGWAFGLTATLGTHAAGLALSWTATSLLEAALWIRQGQEPRSVLRAALRHAAAATLILAVAAPPMATIPGLGSALAGLAILLRAGALAKPPDLPLNGFVLVNPVLAASAVRLLDDPAGLAVPGAIGLLWWLSRIVIGRPSRQEFPTGLLAGSMLATPLTGSEAWRIAVAGSAAIALAAAVPGLARRGWQAPGLLAVGGLASLALARPGWAGWLLVTIGLGLGGLEIEAVQRALPEWVSVRRRLQPAISLPDWPSLAVRNASRWVRSATELLEGQSAVLWMFLALLAIAVASRGGAR